jgi:protein-tyrosine-phosphatase/DNA-binding HxlR family transcriptional regulator
MEVESYQTRAAIHAALGEPIRLRIVDGLALGDLTPGELARVLEISPNLLAHHLAVLTDAGLIHRTPSHGDGRRKYVRLDRRAFDLAAVPTLTSSSVLFVCTHNSARSQLAAALWNRRSDIPASSAGANPAARSHPGAVAVAARHGIRLAAVPRGYDTVDERPDLVVSVCDRAREAAWPFGETRHLHWSIADPAEIGTDEAFEAAFAEIAARIDTTLPSITKGTP